MVADTRRDGAPAATAGGGAFYEVMAPFGTLLA